ncbi:MAG: hypothetical protein HKO66_03265 [Saprospiraceae bacterium]|nr:hypothetical protein [Bacteroidia bacterium]NNL91234.1 hypothetical protein [Saprospiraceae bacterium]
MKNNHTLYSDNEFERAFKSCDLPPDLFTHEAHIRLAWIHLNKYGELDAINNILEDIRRFDNTFGNGNKFHKSITVAAVKTVKHFISKSVWLTFEEFIESNPKLLTSFSDLILYHYSKDAIFSEKAKTEYVEPDLIPFI